MRGSPANLFEVHRVLRPGGHVVYSDPSDQVKKMTEWVARNLCWQRVDQVRNDASFSLPFC
eukprot:501580-Prorocentrum_minimum.AAC.1